MGARGDRDSSRASPTQRGLEALEVHALDSPAPNALDDDANADARDCLAGSGDSPEQRVDEATDSRHVIDAEVDPHQLAKLVNGDAARNPEARPIFALDVRLLDVVLVANLADDLLAHVLDRDESGGPTILITNDRDVGTAVLEVAKLGADGLGRRNEHGAANETQPATPRFLLGDDGAEQIFRVEDADHIVERFVIDGEAGMLGAAHAIEHLGPRRRRGDADDVDTWDHDLADLGVAQRKHAVQQLRLRARDIRFRGHDLAEALGAVLLFRRPLRRGEHTLQRPLERRA